MVLVALDTAGGDYWLYMCGIQGQLKTIFLVNDAQNGVAILQVNALKNTVIGRTI